jgi:hypothetical protein
MIHLYVDESSQTGHRYLVLGGIMIQATDVEHVTSLIDAARIARRPMLPKPGELKWKKVTRQKYDAYWRVTDAFFRLMRLDKVHFHCLIIDTQKLDRRHHQNDKETGFSKMLYQLLAKFARAYKGNEIQCYLDSRDTKYGAEYLSIVLNRGLAKHYNVKNDPFKFTTFRNSKDCSLLQANDIILGAIAAYRNEHHLKPDASAAKAKLAAYILQQGRIKDLTLNTGPRVKCFAVWNFLPGEKSPTVLARAQFALKRNSLR